jgi:hypothetical protein
MVFHRKRKKEASHEQGTNEEAGDGKERKLPDKLPANQTKDEKPVVKGGTTKKQ